MAAGRLSVSVRRPRERVMDLSREGTMLTGCAGWTLDAADELQRVASQAHIAMSMRRADGPANVRRAQGRRVGGLLNFYRRKAG